MKMIAVIGNSHIAALKLGWDARRSDFAGVELRFFGTPADNIENISVSEGRLVPRTPRVREDFVKISGGYDSIDANYDGYLICGQFGIKKLQRLCGDYRAEGYLRDQRVPISDECFAECLYSGLRDAGSIGIVEKLRMITDAPVTVMHQAMRSDEDVESPLARVSATSDAAKIRETFMAASERLAREFGFELFPQPPSTLSGPLQTKSVYARGSVRLAGGLSKVHPSDDYWHMNAAYGALVLGEWLDSALPALNCPRQGRRRERRERRNRRALRP